MCMRARKIARSSLRLKWRESNENRLAARCTLHSISTHSQPRTIFLFRAYRSEGETIIEFAFAFLKERMHNRDATVTAMRCNWQTRQFWIWLTDSTIVFFIINLFLPMHGRTRVHIFFAHSYCVAPLLLLLYFFGSDSQPSTSAHTWISVARRYRQVAKQDLHTFYIGRNDEKNKST